MAAGKPDGADPDSLAGAHSCHGASGILITQKKYCRSVSTTRQRGCVFATYHPSPQVPVQGQDISAGTWFHEWYIFYLFMYAVL